MGIQSGEAAAAAAAARRPGDVRFLRVAHVFRLACGHILRRVFVKRVDLVSQIYYITFQALSLVNKARVSIH